MPSWLERILIDTLMKLLTPETVKKIEDAAKAFVIAELRQFAATTQTDIDDQLVEKLALILGVPFTK